MKKKYLIVGQGIAGTLMTFELLQKNQKVNVIDKPDYSKASKYAAGIINPITGRKYVKSWMFDSLKPEFIKTYSAIGQLLDNDYLTPRIIYRAIPSVKDLNNWDSRFAQEGYAEYMSTIFNIEEYETIANKKMAYGKVLGFQLQISSLVSDFRIYLEEHGLYQHDYFDFGSLNIQADKIYYKDQSYDHIVFCEGYKVSENPYFNELPFTPAKGEFLLVRIPGFTSQKLLKDQIFIAPWKEDIYWVGASYAWTDFNDIGSEEKRNWLLNKIEDVLKVPYEIIEHLAGVRPATKFRKPLMGTHRKYRRIHLFNGLGTKGSSLGPYWAKKMAAYLIDDIPLPEIVDIEKIAS